MGWGRDDVLGPKGHAARAGARGGDPQGAWLSRDAPTSRGGPLGLALLLRMRRISGDTPEFRGAGGHD